MSGRVVRTLVVSTIVAAFLSGPLAPIAPAFGLDIAYAKAGGNGGGNGGSNAGGKGDGKAKGKGKAKKTQTIKAAANANFGLLASELKALEAILANPGVLSRASKKSQIGRYRAYLEAARATILARATASQKPSAQNTDALKAAMAAEAAALEAAANGRPLSADAVEMIRDILGV